LETCGFESMSKNSLQVIFVMESALVHGRYFSDF
jgi:hypothetical protein